MPDAARNHRAGGSVLYAYPIPRTIRHIDHHTTARVYCHRFPVLPPPAITFCRFALPAITLLLPLPYHYHVRHAVRFARQHALRIPKTPHHNMRWFNLSAQLATYASAFSAPLLYNAVLYTGLAVPANAAAQYVRAAVAANGNAGSAALRACIITAACQPCPLSAGTPYNALPPDL